MKYITRRVFIRLAEEAMDWADESAVAQGADPLTKAQRRRLRATAKRMTRFALGAWVKPDENCGCLVGKAFPELISQATSQPKYGTPASIIRVGTHINALVLQRRRAGTAAPPFVEVRDR